MGLNWIMWGSVILIGVLSAVLLSGHGGSLIAGYNTASKEEQAKYDEKKLCRVTGAGMAVITVLLILLTLFPENSWVILIFTIGTLLVCIGCITLSNTICRVKSTAPPATGIENKRFGKGRAAALVISVITAVVVSLLLFTGDITVSLNKTTMDINVSQWSDCQIPYKDIQSVTYKENINLGSRTNGLGSPKLQAGNFKNNDFGNYHLYAYTSCKSYLVLETDNGIVVINNKDKKVTKQLYEKLKKKMEELKL